MDTSHAEKMIDAMRHPDAGMQQALQERRHAEARQMAARRLVAWLVLAAMALGTGAALLSGRHVVDGALWGGLAAAAIGWPLALWRGRRGA